MSANSSHASPIGKRVLVSLPYLFKSNEDSKVENSIIEVIQGV